MEIISEVVYEVDASRCYGENSAQGLEIHPSNLHLLLIAIPILALHLRLRLRVEVRGNPSSCCLQEISSYALAAPGTVL